MISHFFTGLYQKDIVADQSEVDKFFQKLKRPVDVAREVLAGNAKEVNVFPLIGGIAIGFSVLSLVILIIPGARTSIRVNLLFSVVLFLIGAAMLASKYVNSAGRQPEP